MDRARIRRARLAVSLLFLTNGAIFSNLLPRLPEFKDMFELSNAAYGLAVIAFPIGGVVAGPLPAPVLRRFGTARTAAVGSVLLAGAVFVAGSVPVLAVFGAGLFVAGVLDAVVDTAQNAQGLRVQRLAGTSMINSMHALWSVGAVIGGLMGTAAAALHVPLAWHFLVSGVVFAAVAVVAMRWAVPDDHEAHAAAQAENLPVDTAGIPRLPRGRRAALLALLPIAVVAVSGVLVEDVGSNWSAVYLRDVLAAPVGLGAVALAPAPWLALVGFALAGFGCATMVPNAYAAADHAPGLKPGTGLTLVSWCMRIVFVLSPPLVGVLADAVGLRTALLIFPVMGVLAFLFAGALRERRRS